MDDLLRENLESGEKEEEIDEELEELMNSFAFLEDLAEDEENGEESEEEAEEAEDAGEEEEHKENHPYYEGELNEDELRMYGIDHLEEEEVRKILPYLKKVSSNFNKLHQKTLERLKEYELLGTPEDVKNALEILRAIEENPEEALSALLEYGIISKDEAESALGEEKEVVEDGSEEEEEPQGSEEMDRLVEEFAKGVESLKSKYGDFDERLLIPFLDLTNMDFEEAYRAMLASAYKVSRGIATFVPSAVGGSSVSYQDKRPPKTLEEATRAALEYMKNYE